MAKDSDESKPIPLDESYWYSAQTPLQSLFFLIPLILFYEISLIVLGTKEVRELLPQSGPISDIKARRILFDFFDILGINNYYLPGLVVVAVLLGWHFARRDPLRFDLKLYLLMWLESFVLALPLFVFALVFARKWMVAAIIAAGGADSLHGLEAIVLSIGAGIYEELLFRLVGIAVLHAIMVDWFKWSEKGSAVAIVVITAVVFSLYHDPFAEYNIHRLSLFIFYTCAGVYFAVVYLLRGFGIVAWTHALYDVLAFVQRMQG